MNNASGVYSKTNQDNPTHSFSEIDALLKKSKDNNNQIKKVRDQSISYNHCGSCNCSEVCAVFCFIPILTCADGVNYLAGKVGSTFAALCIGCLGSE